MESKSVLKSESQTEIKGKLYLVTSYYSDIRKLNDVLLQAVEREINLSEKDEKNKSTSYNETSNIYSR